MSIIRKTLLTAALVTAIWGSAGWAQQLKTEQVIDRIVQRENDEVKMLSQYDPIIETYVQDISSEQQAAVPVTDHYFLGKAILSQGTLQLPASGKKKTKHTEVKLGGVKEPFDRDSIADGFLHLIYLDPNGFNRQNYRLDYVRREFVGEVRCFVFDVTPLEKREGGSFLGRIWVEDQGYTIIRFNGANSRGENSKRLRLHFDSWRVNQSPGVWVPAYIYSAGSDASESHVGHVVFRAETRFWGYGRPIEPSDRSLAESIRAEERATEESAIDRLEGARLLAPKGGVDKILSTVVNNLEVSNNLDIEPDIECRVLLTSTLESFPIGHTIVMSRGLLDVLPDESSLAMVLAHQMGHIVSGHSQHDEWALRDWSNFLFEDASFDHFGFPIDPRVEDAANAKALELLGRSPYRDKMTNTALFLQAVDSQKRNLPNFISIHVASLVPLAAQQVKAAQETGATQGIQIAALPLGSRVDLDLWTDQVEITKRKSPASTSKREGQPFQINPTVPYLVRNNPSGVPEQIKTTQ